MARLAGLLIFLCAVPVAQAKMPENFLRVKSEAWSRWLDEDMNVFWHGVSLEHVLKGEFGAADISVDNANDFQTPITFDAVGHSRREVLWTLSKRLGFTFHWNQTVEPRIFLEVPETECRKRSIGGVTVMTMTAVMRADYETYQKAKQANEVDKENQIGDTIYYSVKINRDLPFPNGASAWFTEIERYKVTIQKSGIQN